MKKAFNQFLPSKKEIKSNKILSFWGMLLNNSSLWYFNRKSISKAFAIGLFCAFIPIPFQMLLAVPIAIFLSANLPISIALVWISNPFTIPIIFYACYQLGAFVLDTSIEQKFIMSFSHIWEIFATIWQPFLLGCLIFSIVSSCTGYWTIQLIYRYRAYRHTKRNND